jgi:uncharacterized protein (DUF342 family)
MDSLIAETGQIAARIYQEWHDYQNAEDKRAREAALERLTQDIQTYKKKVEEMTLMVQLTQVGNNIANWQAELDQSSLTCNDPEMRKKLAALQGEIEAIRDQMSKLTDTAQA